ncbi:MAG TPA: hypothetical protein VJ953_20325 [Saprospiraceae bacterium]|nr:hypothetical protein [Saprospiraceae bacterium]
MRYLITFVILSLSLSFSACTSLESTAEESAFQTMMDVHDEIMPKMGEVNQLSRQLKGLSAATDTTKRELMGEIDNAVRSLESADQDMMAWMNVNGGNKLEQLQKEKTHDETMAYILDEEEKIIKIKEDIENSIQQAQNVLEKVEVSQ